MNNTKKSFAGIGAALLLAATVLAQPATDQKTSEAAKPTGNANGGRNATAANASANAGIETVKPLIKATYEEWKVIGPKLQAVVTARQAAITYTAAGGGGGGGFPGGFGGGRGGPNSGTDSLVGPEGDARGGGRGPGDRDNRGGPPQGGPDNPGGFDPANFQGRGPGGGGDRGGGGPGGGAINPVAAAMTELKTALAGEAPVTEQITAKVAAVREVRKKAVTDLAAAQKNLLLLLTPDQEATLVSLGYID